MDYFQRAKRSRGGLQGKHPLLGLRVKSGCELGRPLFLKLCTEYVSEVRLWLRNLGSLEKWQVAWLMAR